MSSLDTVSDEKKWYDHLRRLNRISALMMKYRRIPYNFFEGQLPKIASDCFVIENGCSISLNGVRTIRNPLFDRYDFKACIIWKESKDDYVEIIKFERFGSHPIRQEILVFNEYKIGKIGRVKNKKLFLDIIYPTKSIPIIYNDVNYCTPSAPPPELEYDCYATIISPDGTFHSRVQWNSELSYKLLYEDLIKTENRLSELFTKWKTMKENYS